MRYYSTNGGAERVDFKDATILGLAPDKGLFFPEQIPALDERFIGELECYTNEEIGYKVMKPYVGEAIPDEELRRIISETLSFDMPLVQVCDRIASLELFHGPTFAFKDLGARFMSRCMGYFAHESKRKMTVLVATSGDTGGAVAHGFYSVPGVEVVILYPSKKVSMVQEKQLTTLGKNIFALEVDGNFDDCQRLVKEAFADNSLREKIFLTSANSINVARWLPQQLFYFYAYKQWKMRFAKAPVVAVPSGNFGNICSGMVAARSGIPVKKFVVACNVNDAVVSFLKKGEYTAKDTISTLSNAMDVGNPSNFVRLLELYGHSYSKMVDQMVGYTIGDSETRYAIVDTYNRFGYWLDPHGAVAFSALNAYLEKHPDECGFFLETAHPVKFNCGVDLDPPIAHNIAAELASLSSLPSKSTPIRADFNELKSFLCR